MEVCVPSPRSPTRQPFPSVRMDAAAGGHSGRWGLSLCAGRPRLRSVRGNVLEDDEQSIMGARTGEGQWRRSPLARASTPADTSSLPLMSLPSPPFTLAPTPNITDAEVHLQFCTQRPGKRQAQQLQAHARVSRMLFCLSFATTSTILLIYL